MNRNSLHCRMCIARDDNREFIPLTGNNAHLKQKFEFCFSIPLNSSDLNVLCPKCADKLTEIAMIFMIVKDSDSFFNQLLSSGSRQNRPEYFEGWKMKDERWNITSPDYNPLEQEQYHRRDSFPKKMVRFTDGNVCNFEPIPQLVYTSSYQNNKRDEGPSGNWNSNRPTANRKFHHDHDYSQRLSDQEPSGTWNNDNNFSHSQRQNQGRKQSDSIELSDSEDVNPEFKNSFIRNGHRFSGLSRSRNQGKNQSNFKPIPQLMYPSSYKNNKRDEGPSGNWNSNRPTSNRKFHHDHKYSQRLSDQEPSGTWNNDKNFSGQNQGRNQSDSIEISDFEDDNHHRMPHSNNFKCPFCDEPFQFFAVLKLHLNLFDHMRCNSCKFRSENLNKLQHHVKICKRGQDSFECPYCLKKFGSANGCNNHIDAVHKFIPNCL